MEQTIILCGLGRVGWRVLEYLRAAGFPVVVVDTRCRPNDPRLGDVKLINGDFRRPEVLEEAGLAQARGVIIMTNDDLVNISAALMVRHQNPDVRIVVRLFNQNLIARLGKAVNNVFALSTSMLTAPLFAQSALTGQALGTIRIEGLQDGLRQVAEVKVDAGSPLRGQPIANLVEERDLLVFAHLPQGDKERFLLDVDMTATLSPGDRVILCGDPHKLAPLLEGGEDLLAHVRWAGWLRRLGRVVWRTLSEADLPVKVCTALLLSVVAISTLIMYLGVEKHHGHLARALFRTISLMATGSSMHEEELTEDWQMVFASTLRILGALLTAAFTAIMVNYLLRARLAGALEVRRIPDSGHVIVCGLGNIGFRVVEELVRYEERVVVIEQARDSKFVTTARRLGVPVLIGDATVNGVLHQAHAIQARAVIASTSDDLINLEIALLVRELNPSQRIVLHLSDPSLAQTLREAANVRLALSIPNLAAPAFIAALFGDRVQSVLMIDGRLVATVDLLVPAQDPCLAGQSVRAVAIDYGLLPVVVCDTQGRLLAQRMSARLDAGFRLIAISLLPDLERLLRREPRPKDYAVDVDACPLPTRPWLASLFRVQQGLTAEAANKMLEQMPTCLATRLTRGQAEDLLLLLKRERIGAKIRRLDEQA
ncbi:MAG TPA: NAD-binding protein [Gemmataceae bacterium]|nr:NAD-binding protein [Gemmataceae bacterium]